MGASEGYTWYSAVGVFLTESALQEYAESKGISTELRVMTPDAKGEVLLSEPQEFVAVQSAEGAVPGVELAEQN